VNCSILLLNQNKFDKYWYLFKVVDTNPLKDNKLTLVSAIISLQFLPWKIYGMAFAV